MTEYDSMREIMPPKRW